MKSTAPSNNTRETLRDILNGSLTAEQAKHRLEQKGPAFVIVSEHPKRAVTPDAIYWHEVKTYEGDR